MSFLRVAMAEKYPQQMVMVWVVLLLIVESRRSS